MLAAVLSALGLAGLEEAAGLFVEVCHSLLSSAHDLQEVSLVTTCSWCQTWLLAPSRQICSREGMNKLQGYLMLSLSIFFCIHIAIAQMDGFRPVLRCPELAMASCSLLKSKTILRNMGLPAVSVTYQPMVPSPWVVSTVALIPALI